MGLLNMKGTDIDRLGAAQMQEELAQANGQNAASVPQAPQKSFFGRMYEHLQDPYNNARVVNALNSLRMRPSASLAASTQATMAEGRQLSKEQAIGNKTEKYFTSIGREDLAQMVRANPQMAQSIYAAYVQQELKPDAKYTQKSGAQLNEEMGVTAFEPTKMYNVDAQNKVTGIGGDAPVTNIDLGADSGIEAVNKKISDDYVSWLGGGSADATKNVAQISNAINMLQSGDITTGVKSGLIARSGLGAFLDPEGTGLREQVEEVVQRNLRVVLGAQFTEKEGERLINRAYNPALSTQQNLKKLNALFTQMQTALDQKNAMMDYFQKNNFNIFGYKGNIPSVTDFERALDAVNAPQVGDVINNYKYIGGDPSQESSWEKVN